MFSDNPTKADYLNDCLECFNALEPKISTSPRNIDVILNKLSKKELCSLSIWLDDVCRLINGGNK